MVSRCLRTGKNKDSKKEKNSFFTIKYRDECPIYITSKQSDDEHYLTKLLGSGTEWSVRPGRKAAKLRRCGMEATVNSRRKMNYGSTAQSYSNEC